MSTNNTAKLIASIEPPYKLSERQVNLVKLFVQSRLMDGFTIANFCTDNSISTKTWYSWNEDEDFKFFVNQLSDVIIDPDERTAYESIKKKILAISQKQAPSIKELELFLETFSYLVEADKRSRMEALGLVEGKKPLSANSVAERKKVLLQRLKG